jgi:transcription antitermination factor NusG
MKHLGIREIDSFCPTYETVRVWKNRQRAKLVLPLFPGYLFVRICLTQWRDVLGSPGVLKIVGRKREYSVIADGEISWLQSRACKQGIEPFRDLVIGERVRIKRGVLQGVQGTLVQKGDSKRFVLTLELINQHAAIQVNAEDLEPMLA